MSDITASDSCEDVRAGRREGNERRTWLACWRMLLRGVANTLGKRTCNLLHALPPCLSGGRAQDGAYLEEDICLGGPREQRAQHHQLHHHASDSPDIDRSTVARASEQDLGGPVPAGRDVICLRRPRERLLCQAEVCDFGDVPTDEDVFGLDVAVEVAAFVHVTEALQHVKHVVADRALWEGPPPALAELVEVLLEELEDEIQDILLFDHLFEPDNVRMLHLAQDLHLLERHALLPRAVLPLHPLHSDHLPSGLVGSLEDLSVRPIPQLLHHAISVHGQLTAARPPSHCFSQNIHVNFRIAERCCVITIQTFHNISSQHLSSPLLTYPLPTSPDLTLNT
eukprot:768570-Hanusia_phi.AAC.3